MNKTESGNWRSPPIDDAAASQEDAAAELEGKLVARMAEDFTVEDAIYLLVLVRRRLYGDA